MLWCRNNCEILLAKGSHIKFLYQRRGLFMARNAVTVNINGVATCNSSKKLLQVCSLVVKLIQNFATT